MSTKQIKVGRGSFSFEAPEALGTHVQAFIRKSKDGFRIGELTKSIRDFLGKNRKGVPKGTDLDDLASRLCGAFKRKLVGEGAIAVEGRTWKPT